MTLGIDGLPVVVFVPYHGSGAIAGVGHLDGRALLRDSAQCADCRHFKIRMFEHDFAVHNSVDGSHWTQHPCGLEVSGQQTDSVGGFSSLNLCACPKGSGSVRVEDFRYRAFE